MSPGELSASRRSAAVHEVDPCRERILEQAALLFARDGYRDTDLQDVADALDIGKGSVYRRFPTKRALFLATVDDGMRRLRASVDAASADVEDPLERIVRAVRAYLAFFDGEPRLVELLVQERAELRDRKKSTYFVHREAHLRPWAALFEQLMRDGRMRRVPTSRITDALSSLLYGAIFAKTFSGSARSLAAQADDVLDVVFRGILTDAEKARRPGRAGRRAGGRS